MNRCAIASRSERSQQANFPRQRFWHAYALPRTGYGPYNAANYLAFIRLAPIRLWLCANESIPGFSEPMPVQRDGTLSISLPVKTGAECGLPSGDPPACSTVTA